MKILKIQKNKIFFENNISFSLQKNLINKLHLKEGSIIEKNLYINLLKDSALDYSYWLLSKRDYSKKELQIKLLTKYKETTIISSVITLLDDKCYLNDSQFAENFLASHKTWGKKKLSYFLYLKGIDNFLIEKLLKDNTYNELDNIKKIWIQMKDKDNCKKIQSLLRKGFSYEDIKKAIENL